MMTQITMEFDSEDEAREYASENGLIFVSYNWDNCEAILEGASNHIEKSTSVISLCSISDETIENKKARIFTFKNGSKMYYCKKGAYPFHYSNAIVFSLKQAIEKVKNMNKNTTRLYDWSYEEVK